MMTTKSPFDLSGRTALVTGGNQGLGRAFAFGLAEAGAKVAIVGRNRARNEEVVAAAAESGHTMTAIGADITTRAAVRTMTEQAVQQLGQIDILVNNAGVCFHRESWEVPEEEWDQVFDLNVKALWNCCLEVGAHMRERGSGSIVNIGSMSALVVNRPQSQPAYNASKAAVHQLTKSLAAEWAPLGIRVNAVAPGYVETEMTPTDLPGADRYWYDRTPQARIARPAEIAPSVVFLASDAATFITGSVLVADGGYTAW
ncbi:NAD(P)-dependent dehydrogenase (short-subunit alcohol dehydrogenase family) [Rhodococcus sp. 27YEA15]|uniref:SDR family NAD(P)-dependent oxidoreductase n=1 Tax=Rhodococcus sp. 27YEA15 TaxID=3156259 RepID=UPI003C7BEE20